MQVTGKVYTAGPENRETHIAISVYFERVFGEPVSLAFFRDDSLIGGFRAIVDGKLYDASILAKTKDVLRCLKRTELGTE